MTKGRKLQEEKQNWVIKALTYIFELIIFCSVIFVCYYFTFPILCKILGFSLESVVTLSNFVQIAFVGIASYIIALLIVSIAILLILTLLGIISAFFERDFYEDE